MKNNRKEILHAFSSVTQLGLSVVISFLIWIFFAIWIRNRFHLGSYVTVIGILCGVCSAGITFYNFCKIAGNTGKKEDENEN